MANKAGALSVWREASSGRSMEGRSCVQACCSATTPERSDPANSNDNFSYRIEFRLYNEGIEWPRHHGLFGKLHRILMVKPYFY